MSKHNLAICRSLLVPIDFLTSIDEFGSDVTSLTEFDEIDRDVPQI